MSRPGLGVRLKEDMPSRGLLILLLCLTPVWAQSAKPQAESQGIQPEWDVRPILQSIVNHANRLAPLLNQIDAKSWVAKGAPDTYAAQLESMKSQTKAVASTAGDLSRAPESKLSSLLEMFFRVQGLQNTSSALETGIRKYQNPALADMLAGIMAEGGASRIQLQQYIVDLAAQREQEYQIMDREAQRCRGALSRQPRPAPPRRK